MDGPRAALEAEWLRLTREVLPGLAAARRWPVHADHCFQRILLDAAAGDVWYRRIPGRPAYRAASADLLARAVALAGSVAAGASDLAALNRQSLDLRRRTRCEQGAANLSISGPSGRP
jgi:hypothetical protein